ncbi:hypothetical protein [uncultured Lacinutrix sp.]|uniref:carboxypeptidase-like regulatory domain-containing protein n=1 Tax=uncultured Lacinutrix sp. TaxID=574032 RepID=UPI00262838C8|nr:hypothetical protein [uncultured Lacinutrix sp.]
MRRIKEYYVLIFFFFCTVLSAQNTKLLGRVEAEDNLESIHVINKSKNLFATSNKLGVFKIEAEKNDTLVFSSIQYRPKTIIITQKHITTKTVKVKLEQYVNELQEVIVGNTLTGDLTKDIANAGTKRDINFYDLGIPGYTGKPKTQSERRLQEASDLTPKAGGSLGGFGGSVSLIAVINAISGRTKMLKKRVALEANTALMYKVKSRLSESFFNDNPLDEDKRMDFFYFCAEDKDFTKKCSGSDLITLEFMKEKYIKYKENLNSKE